MKLIIGLGNPDKKYQNTRHNIGFIMLDYFFDEWLKAEGFTPWNENRKFQAMISEGKLNGEKIILAKPLSYMNNSGESAQTLTSFYKIEPRDLIVIHDEIDLIFGNYKIQADKSSAGHKGIESIIEKLGTQAFTRVRVGIGKADKQKQGDTAGFVLNRFGLFEKLKLKELKRQILSEVKSRLQN